MTLTPEIRRKLGVRRSEVAHSIYDELGNRNLNATRIAARLGCSVNNVSLVIRGNSHSPKVLDALREAGIPEKYLFDPRRVAEKMAGAEERV